MACRQLVWADSPWCSDLVDPSPAVARKAFSGKRQSASFCPRAYRRGRGLHRRPPTLTHLQDFTLGGVAPGSVMTGEMALLFGGLFSAILRNPCLPNVPVLGHPFCGSLGHVQTFRDDPSDVRFRG